MTCQARCFGDEMHCHRCNLVWGISDVDQPECLTDREYGNMKLNEIRNMLMSDPADVAATYIEIEENAAIANRVQYSGVSATHCEDCDEPIPEARREAIPGCKRCVTCQSKLENK